MKQAVMYGAGNIGRGFIGQLFQMSGYEVVFVDVNREVVEQLNRDRQYPIYITDGDTYREYPVTGVRAVDGRDPDAVATEIAHAEIMATAVGVGVLKFIAEPIARGVQKRMEQKIDAPLNIIVCENMIGADKFLADTVKSYLDEREKIYFDSHVATVEPSIGRMVPATPKELLERNRLAVCVEPFCELPVDRDAFLGEIPDIVNLQPFSPFDFHIRRKLFLHNMSHALTAYFGAYREYTYIWEAIMDQEIKKLARCALSEISLALSAEYSVPLSELLDFSEELLVRYENKLLGDTVERVGKDTKRKLAPNDRFVAAARLCEKHGIVPANILSGLAAGLHFAPVGDSASEEVVQSIKENGLIHTLSTFCGIEESSPFVPCIERIYRKIESHDDLRDICTSLQNN